MTEVEAAYLRVFEFTRGMIIEAIEQYAADWTANGPSRAAANAIVTKIRGLPAPMPNKTSCTETVIAA